MRLGLSLFTGTASWAEMTALAREADRLGLSVVWVPEAYGSDAPTVCSWLAAATQRIDVGSAVCQIPARSPAMTAMTAATLDALSGGRFRLGLGVSGPQVSEGWHGVRFEAPLERTREYVEVVRRVLSRERVVFRGRHYQLPLPDGEGRPLKLSMPVGREHLPLYLAALGPRNLRLAGEIADGVLLVFLAPEHAEQALAPLRAGRAVAGQDLTGFDVVATAPVCVGDDPVACAEPVRRAAALSIGGMGSRRHNFYNDLARRMGYEEAAAEIQRRFLAGDRDGAAAAVPWQFIDQTSLLGSRERIAARMSSYAAAGVSTLSLSLAATDPAQRLTALHTAVEAFQQAV